MSGSTTGFRVERDSMGEMKIPSDALWGAQTQRAVDNFPISGQPMPHQFIRALGLIKAAAAEANGELGHVESAIVDAIIGAALEVADGKHDRHFPIDVFQTGSGTSSNMNANEVIASLASKRLGKPVHPNDHVNMGQSSNDVIPTAIHVAATLAIREQLLVALAHLGQTLRKRAAELDGVITTGRTHLMDAMPVRLGQELGGWATQVENGRARAESACVRLQRLAQGGTAVGTGINADPRFAKAFAAKLAKRTGVAFEPNSDFFESLSAQDAAVEASGQMKVIAVSLMKIANDLRWMNSGPLAGLGEIALPALQPGSSIMPGKVNPVVPEAVAMIAAQVMGNDATIAVAGQSGTFQLNVMLPVIAHNLLQSIELLANASRTLARSAVAGFAVNTRQIAGALDRNPMLVTALAPVIGYDLAAAIAKRALAEGRPIREVAAEMTDLDERRLAKLLDPAALTKGGVRQRESGD